MTLGYAMPKFSPAYGDPCFCRSGQPFGECCGSRAEHRKPPAGVQVLPGFVDPAVCRKWVARLERQPRQRAVVKDFNRSTATSRVVVEDSARVCDDVQPGVLRKMINDRIAEGFRHALATTDRKLAWFEKPRILRYQPGGFYLRHADSCQLDPDSNAWYKVQDRDLSLLLYLNEDYTGGGLSFVNFNFHYRPVTGDLLVFPSDNRYEHQAEVVNSGIRYVIASWASLSGMRRVCDHPPNGAIHLQAAIAS